MDLQAEINPSDVEDAFLLGLNRSFGHWGDRSTYAWGFEREVGARAADLIVLRGDGVIVAGSAVSYRVVQHDGNQIVVGVMTGSWTLPEARGRGAFGQMIHESRTLTAARGGSLLIAFVTHENASRRRLVAAGCAEVPTWYVASDPDTPPPSRAAAVEPTAAPAQELFRAHLDWQAGGSGASVIYPSIEVWASQFLVRPLPVEVVRAAGARCVVERGTTSDRVLWTDGRDGPAALAALLKRAIESERQLFLFTMDPALARVGADLGMLAKPGSLTVLETLDEGNERPRVSRIPAAWRVQGGDRA